MVYAQASDTNSSPVKSDLLDVKIDEISYAKRKDDLSLSYPSVAARNGQEGWVQVSYIIEPDGTVSNPIIEDSSGLKAFESAALEAIQKATFTPAMQNGQAIQQCDSTIQFEFKLNNQKPGATKKFARHYRKVRKHLESGDLLKAKELLDKLDAMPVWNMYENARLALLKSFYYKSMNDEVNLLKYLYHATNSDGKYIKRDTYHWALSNIYGLEISNGDFHKALKTIKRIQSLDPKYQQQFANIITHSNNLKEHIASEYPIVKAGDLATKDFWSHTLVRNSFAISNVQGRLDKVDIRCKGMRNQMKVILDSIIKVPSSWGTCQVYLYGEDNTTFNFVEVSPTSKL